MGTMNRLSRIGSLCSPFGMQNTSNLKVSGFARRLASEVYNATAAFPASERFGLSAQMRRAAVSIGSNIAEGCGRHGDRTLVSFLQIAMGSASELEFQVELAIDLRLLVATDGERLLLETRRVKRMLAALLASLRMQDTLRNAPAKVRDR
jgi:four helix bundle protein